MQRWMFFISLTGLGICWVTRLAIVNTATLSDSLFVHPHSYYTVRMRAWTSVCRGLGDWLPRSFRARGKKAIDHLCHSSCLVLFDLYAHNWWGHTLGSSGYYLELPAGHNRAESWCPPFPIEDR